MTFTEKLLRLAEDVISSSREHDWRIATAESCTGGLIMGCLTAVPGSSEVMDRGFVPYANQAKIKMLGVDAGLIAAHGAVSEQVAVAMAEGALRNAAADLSVAVTGIAGPGGGTPGKPVGMVHIAAERKGGGFTHERHHFIGDRHEVRMQTVEAALEMLKKLIRQP